jgi:uncharacterized repeat protein (TIGR03803 family)
MKRIATVFVLCAATAIGLTAQTVSTIFSFDLADGNQPEAGLVQGADGNLYGTTFSGGVDCAPYSCGTVFKITASGTLTTLHSFAGYPTEGNGPTGLVQAANGDFYGTTELGGAGNNGTVFSITSSGTLTTLYSFCSHGLPCPDGAVPAAGLVQATNGDFYGTTGAGGANNGGTVFKIAPSGTLTTLYSFCSQGGTLCTDGNCPVAALIQAANGDFYGTTEEGGANDGGTVFKITPSGTLTTLYRFCSQGGAACTDGWLPTAGLVQSINGDFYGTTQVGGVENRGTVFKITPSGTLTALYSFCAQSGCTDGSYPIAGLVQATNGEFYGTTYTGGVYYSMAGPTAGTVFKITPSGTLTTLHSFNFADGYYPYAGLVQGTNGDIYGTTEYGGPNDDGTVFSLSVGLGPFVKALPHSGQAGAVIRILGTDLRGTTSVSFDGTPATFNIVAATEITATVPAGATTGQIQVTTPGGALLSSGPFLVLP